MTLTRSLTLGAACFSMLVQAAPDTSKPATPQEAKAYVTAAIAHADELDIGHGPGPLHHFYRYWSRP